MKKITVFGIVLLIFLGEGNCMMQVEYDYQKDYTETFTRTVGATNRTGVRGTLPQPSPSDANAIWLAPNGSDAAAGTQAAPKLTLNGAIAALTAGKATVHIFRNSYVGDLVFLETTYSILPASRNIQAEDGEKAEIHYDSSTTLLPGFRLGTLGANKINGVAFYDDVAASTETILSPNGAGPHSFDNISLYGISDEGTLFLPQGSITSYSINYSYLEGSQMISTTTDLGFVVNNTIFNTTIIPSAGTYHAAIIISTTNGTPATMSLDRCYFIGSIHDTELVDGGVSNTSSESIYIVGVQALASTGTISLDSCAFINTNNAVVYDDPTSAIDINVNYKNCQLGGAPVSTAMPTTSVSTSIVFTNTDALDGSLPNMLIDESSALNGDIESFRLQRVGLATTDGSGEYFIDSPLVGTGLSGDDINPFDESVALASEGYNALLDMGWPPKAMTIENQYANASSLIDVNGNLHRDYDKERRKFIFTFGNGIHLSNIQLKELRDLLADRGSKKLYPVGQHGNIYEENTVSSGVFAIIDNSLTPSKAATTPMVANHWRGFWVTIGTDSYYISSNDNSKLYLTDKLGLGLPSAGSVSFRVEYILINIEDTAYVYKQESFTQFTKGGFWGEVSVGVQPYDMTIDGVTFSEIEDNEENV